ncbi:MAG: O-antigen ligase family protein [Acidobacteriota bacterium]|nr:O-antigen ligase family protein [Acidobacteriota bacterium]
MRILLLLVAALVPLAIAPHLLFYFDVTPKVVLLLCGAGAALLLGPGRNGWKSLLARPAGRWFCGLLAAQVLSLAISSAFSVARDLSLHGGTWRRFGLLSQVALFAFALISAAWLSVDPDRLAPLLRAIAISGAIAGIYGILQYFGFDPLLDRAAYVTGEGEWAIVRPPGTLGHAGYFATWLLYPIFAGVWLAARDSKPAWRWLGMIAAVLAVVAITLSGTRSALLGLVVGVTVLAAGSGAKVRRYTVGCAMVLALAVAALYVSPAGLPLRARVRWWQEDPAGGARLMLWRDSIRMGAARPVAGFGPETFAGEFPRFESISLASGWPDFYHESPHNMFLDSWTAQGLPGVAVLMMLVALGLVAAWRSRVPELTAGLIAVLAAQQFLAFTVVTALLFYLWVAIAVSLDAPRGAEPNVIRFRIGWIVACVALAAVLVMLAMHLSLPAWYMARAQADLDRGELKAALADSDQARVWARGGWSADLYWSRRLLQFSQASTNTIDKLQAAGEAFQAAVRATAGAEEPQNAWYNLAAFYAARNDAGSAETALRSAIQHAPCWFKPHWTLAKLLQATARLPEASAEADTAVTLDGGKHPGVLETQLHLHPR